MYNMGTRINIGTFVPVSELVGLYGTLTTASCKHVITLYIATLPKLVIVGSGTTFGAVY